MIYLRRIQGNSMYPALRNGDYIVALAAFQKNYIDGDIVIVSHPQYAEIIKRIKFIDDLGNFWLAGDGSDTLSTQQMGAIKPEQVMAKLWWHIKAKPTP